MKTRSLSRAPAAIRRGDIRARNENAILRAAEQVFGTHGYHGTSTAMIAARAGLPKANLHYYFRTKGELYQRLLESIIAMWWEATRTIQADEDPVEAITRLVRTKVEHSRRHPLASKIFAAEVINGAPHIMKFLRKDLRAMVQEKAAVIESWIAQGKMDPVDPRHFFFQIWAMTQTYADFSEQVAAVLGQSKLRRSDFDTAADAIVRLVLKGMDVRSARMQPRIGSGARRMQG